MERGYLLVEIDIPQDWELDLLVKCHEVVRRAFPGILPEASGSVAFDLIAVTSPHNPGPGPHYPAIGIHCPDQAAEDSIAGLSFFDFYDRANHWIAATGLEELKRRACAIQDVSWPLLKARHTYPDR
ncbi:hypothetical protein [Hymenobacter rubripertinctus]|uniref:Uncharacterized protein n=1 Tax=Hymenobacter rubripertinctus TaxID=2029981 RepID=A0A418R043_9BACT|nr:hypothetical protein [Hymenobacter rubripertinctus]RIY10820.1 hypothetical protein D0T11_09160 [Hymenobacter rubripertinctus]